MNCLAFHTYAYPKGLQAELLELGARGSVAQLCTYNVLLGQLFAEAALDIARRARLRMEDVFVVGSHGQTVYHAPDEREVHGRRVRATLQIGDPSVIAVTCRATTVGDFRVADVAAGGQGAPLVPYFDLQIFGRNLNDGEVVLLLNVGGICNVTALIRNDSKTEVVAFDCGPGNMVIDGLMQDLFDEPFDRNGQMAAKGKVVRDLLVWMCNDPFLQRRPPKSTGREMYGKDYRMQLHKKAQQLNVSNEDFIATATEFTVEAVRSNYDSFLKPKLENNEGTLRRLLVSGGGVHNTQILRHLTTKFSEYKVGTTDDEGINSDAKEAMCFAYLAYQTLKGNQTNLPDVTGATEPVLLGKICPVLTPAT
ncbi:anhydro-N-acetylmuramic acid kinase-like isoform X2 [Oscarella lobularis]